MHPWRESGLRERTRRLPWLCRLLLETREPGFNYDTGVYQHHHGLRSFRRQQPTSPATSKPVAVYRYYRNIDRAAVDGF